MASSPPFKRRFGLIGEHEPTLAPGAAWLVVAWLLCCALLLWLARGNLPTLGFRDPDDAMRLQQVRDWIAGQPFLDVRQHRVSPPLGGPMHWSRIVDVPIATMILALRPMLGPSLAEIIACVLAPLLLLGSLTWALFAATRKIAGQTIALLAAVLLLVTPTILVQFGPLRIDHHGWQILMAVIALGGAMDSRRAVGGVVAGLALAFWLQISSEGLPYAALFGAIFALRQWRAPEETTRFIAFAITLGGVALPMLALLRGSVSVMQQQCDSFSAAYAWPLLAFAVATPCAFRLIGSATSTGRILAATLGGGAAVAVFVISGRPCLTGDPFAALGPIAYKLWYLQVMEGRPIWEQSRSMAGLILLPSIAGMAGALIAARASQEVEARERWIVLTLLLMGATLVAMLVMRAMSVAHVLALPGTSWLMLHLFRRAQQQTIAPIRVIASSAVALLSPAALCGIWIAATAASEGSEKGDPSPASDCRTAAALTPLRQLPTSTLFAPLDVGPDILIRTPHSVVGTAHHRNAKGITAVVEGFTAPPARARAILSGLNGGKGPDYLIACPSLSEFKHYSKEHGDSLAAVLDQGKAPAWLKQVALPGSKSLRVYKVMPARN